MPTWIAALKEWNAGKGTWCIPRKGTEGHAEVVAIMKGGPKKDDRPYAKAPGVASAIGKLREVEAATRERNVGRKASAKKPSRVKDVGSWLGELLFGLMEEGVPVKGIVAAVVRKAEAAGITNDALLGAIPDIDMPVRLNKALRAALA